MEEKAEASKEKAKAIEESNELEMLKTDPETIINPGDRLIFFDRLHDDLSDVHLGKIIFPFIFNDHIV
jgi:hypothetical protein